MEWLYATITAGLMTIIPAPPPVKIAPGSKCAVMQRLAQEHANDMARRDHLDHDGFYERRGPKGVRAENVAYGCATQGCAIEQWRRSPPHAANISLPGCKGVASAVSKSGKRYWTMEIAR
jgi:uncharacterized protein YkwD